MNSGSRGARIGENGPDYDEGDREWSEDYLLAGLAVTASNFTTGTIEQFLEDVVQRADTNPVKRMRLAALPPPAMTWQRGTCRLGRDRRWSRLSSRTTASTCRTLSSNGSPT